jgi:sulfur-oxidizing protein SoxY
VSQMKRRTFLKGAFAGSVIAVAAGGGLLRPSRVLAAEWPESAFTAKNVDDAIKNLYGGMPATESKDVTIRAPLQAENGAKVPITVKTGLPNVESMDILVQENVQPLSGRANLSAAAAGFFSTRIKMGKSSAVHAVVKAGGKLYRTKMNIKVTVGGCGG